jgi:hypothetical protein
MADHGYNASFLGEFSLDLARIGVGIGNISGGGWSKSLILTDFKVIHLVCLV